MTEKIGEKFSSEVKRSKVSEVFKETVSLIEGWMKEKGLDCKPEKCFSSIGHLEGRIVIGKPPRELAERAYELLKFIKKGFGKDFKVRLFVDDDYIVFQVRPRNLLDYGKKEEEKLVAESMIEEYSTIVKKARKRGDNRITKWHIARALDAWGYTEAPPVAIVDTSAFTPEQGSDLVKAIQQVLGESREYDELFWSGLQKVLDWFAVDFNAGTFDTGGW